MANARCVDSSDPTTLTAARVLPHYEGLAEARIQPIPSGLINQTFLISTAERRVVLQRVSPIFPPGIHDNIEAVTARLAAAGMVTPLIVRARDGRLWVELETGAGVWRVMTFVDGASFDAVESPAQAHAAGALIARFHRTLDDLPHTFANVRKGAHDTPRHIERLRAAVAKHGAHRLFAQVAPLASEILAAADTLPALPSLEDRVCHGDPKFNNVRFLGTTPAAREQALCLIDLDTVGPSKLSFELGDAWRSWCNRNGEDAPVAALDLEIFRASVEGYREALARGFTSDEQRALLLAVEWISLELAARFAADALDESYFGWDPGRFAARGEHNLIRARGQWSLHRAFVDARDLRARILSS